MHENSILSSLHSCDSDERETYCIYLGAPKSHMQMLAGVWKQQPTPLQGLWCSGKSPIFRSYLQITYTNFVSLLLHSCKSDESETFQIYLWAPKSYIETLAGVWKQQSSPLYEWFYIAYDLGYSHT